MDLYCSVARDRPFHPPESGLARHWQHGPSRPWGRRACLSTCAVTFGNLHPSPDKCGGLRPIRSSLKGLFRMGYLLLTGATGLLGGYLLRDALRAEMPVAVIVRRTAALSAQRRIDAVLSPFESERALPRPVVLEGDLSHDQLGLSDDDFDWISRHCDRVLHSAASISFYREERTGEPYRSNVDGTRRLIDLCHEAGIEQFHHVSTAYVCGRRSGRVLESELDVGQQHGNDYERSKVAAENLVRTAGFAQAPTIYRPSIIVGDSQSGYTTTFHGFYTPLQLAWMLAKEGKVGVEIAEWFLAKLGLTGEERKNIVPVDWVAQAIINLIQQTFSHGRTFHLTCANPPTARELAQAIGDAITAHIADHPAMSRGTTLANLWDEEVGKHMDVYRAYFRDHPEFDTSNLRQAAPQLPCPTVDRTLLARTARFALEANFGWPRPAVPAAPVMVDAILADFPISRHAGTSLACALEITGCGGGSWTFDLSSDAGVSALVDRGRAIDAGIAIRMRSDTLARLREGELKLDEAMQAGRVIVQGRSAMADRAVRFVKQLIEQRQGNKPAKNGKKQPLAMGEAV
jgi:thioester reductase-like protein